MGVYTYWLVVLCVLILGILMPQEGYKRKYYIIVITIVQIFVCGFRYMYLTGDLRKYAATYYELPNKGWFSESVWAEGRNAGFQWFMKFFSQLTGGDFQIALIVLAIITQVCLAIIIYKFSPKPWLSFFVWNCMAFYVTYDFTSIKQGLAMAILMIAMNYILEEKPVKSIIATLVASFIHMPALCFIPAYLLYKGKVRTQTILFYIISAGIIFIYRNQIINIVTEFYYSDNNEMEFIANVDILGGRFAMICLVLLAGLLLQGFRNREFEGLFMIIVVAAIFQMFSSYNNVFTRLADYYLQFCVLFIPMIFYEPKRPVRINKYASYAVLPFNERSIRLIVAVLVLILIWWYWRTCLGVTITYAPDDYTKFRFMWEVVN